MNSQSTQERADADLRALLAQTDPLAGEPSPAPEALLARIRGEIAHFPVASEAAEHHQRYSGTSTSPHHTWFRRHWQGFLLTAACVATIGLAAGVLFPSVLGSFSGSVAGATARDEAGSELATAGPAAPAVAGDTSNLLKEPTTSPATAGDVGTQSTGTDVSAPQLARSASVLVGTDDIATQRDTFVAKILAMGGRVMSESTITANSSERATSSSPGGDVYPQSGAVVAPDVSGYSYPTPYPWYPSGPGVWLSVEVPVAEYDRAIEAARATGEVVRLEQSSSDMGTQMADIEGRIAALESSLARLTSLMGQATSVSDVIALEEAIAQRQAELDSLRAQQNALTNQTAMSRVSLTLMSVADAKASVSPPTSGTWWEALLDGLSQFWLWLGKALLIVSPLLLAAGLITWVRRRHQRPAEPSESLVSESLVADAHTVE